ncbi:KxYKxGKxW signal peptide domain-containing protein, partial [Bacillus paranthracis]
MRENYKMYKSGRVFFIYEGIYENKG